MRWTRYAAAAAIAATLIACRGQVSSDRPASDRQVDPRAARTVVIQVTEASGPYHLTIRAHEAGQSRGDWTREDVAGGRWRQTLDYTSGLHIEVAVTVRGHADDMYACQIVDGPHHRDRSRGLGGVHCQLTTSQ